MNMKKKNESLRQEYLSFCNEVQNPPYQEIGSNQIVQAKILWDLKYGAWVSGAKVIFAQVLTGAASLLLCPQFHLGLTSQKYVVHTFHHSLGAEGCMVACGAIFLGSGALLGILLLRKDEIQRLRFSFIGSFFLIALFAIFTFIVLGAEVYFKEGLWWILGAFSIPSLIFILDKNIRGKTPVYLGAASLKIK
ncbi:MAG: hypothetical protein HYV97_11500 [Bdellovibrio sp.]|nr:hypothetical protein [Bdellovibrio sp.]